MIFSFKKQHFYLKNILLVIFSLFFTIAVSQEKTISGIVIDSSGNPIPGVNILEESNKNNGAVTDFDGNF